MIDSLLRSYSELWKRKLVLKKQGMDPNDIEYEPSVVELKQKFQELFFQAWEAQLDPTAQIVHWLRSLV